MDEVSFDSRYEPQEVSFAQSAPVHLKIAVDPTGWTRKEKKSDLRIAKFRQAFLSFLRLKVPTPTLWDGPVAVEISFRVPRPESAAARMYPLGRPKLDALCRGLMEMCNKYLWLDEAQIVSQTMTKAWADVPAEMGIEIVARQICSRAENERRLSRRKSNP